MYIEINIKENRLSFKVRDMGRIRRWRNVGVWKEERLGKKLDNYILIKCIKIKDLQIIENQVIHINIL